MSTPGRCVPFTGAATTESRGVHVPFLSPVFYPSTMWTPNYFGALAGNGGTQLLVSPVQYRAASVADGTSTQRRHTGMNLRLFYSGNLSQAALSDAPSIVAVDAQQDAGGVTFTAQVVGDPAAAIHQVWVTYTGDGAGAWTSLDLSQCVAPLPAACGASEDSRLWKGRLASPPANLKYFVQAVNGVGLVARNDNVGAYFGIAQRHCRRRRRSRSSRRRRARSSATVPTVTAKLTYAGGVALAGKIGRVGVGGASRLGMTGSDGSVTVRMPVVADPGSYLITAAFAGDDVFQPSSASAPLTINRAPVTPTMLPPSAASAGINITGALGGTNAGLQQVPVAFTVNGPERHDDGLCDHRLPRQRDLPAAVGPAAGQLHGDAGDVRRQRDLRADHDHVPDAAAGLGAEARPEHHFDRAAPTRPSAIRTSRCSPRASSGLAVSYGASGACTVAGSTVHLTGTGSCTITRDQAGDATYNAAATVTRSFAIAAAGRGADRGVAGARRAESDDGRHASTYTLTFSEAVTGVAASNFAVATSGITGSVGRRASAAAGTTWTVTVNTGRGTGTLHLDVVNGTGITNTGGTPLAGTPFTGETYQIDKGGTVIGSGEGQPVAGFGNGGYALFSDVPIATAPGRVRVLSDGRILAAGGIGCAANVNPNDPRRRRTARCSSPDTRRAARRMHRSGPNGRVVTAVTNVNSGGERASSSTATARSS